MGFPLFADGVVSSWSRSRFFKIAGVGFSKMLESVLKKVWSRSQFFELEQFMGWTRNPKKSSDSTTLFPQQSNRLVEGYREISSLFLLCVPSSRRCRAKHVCSKPEDSSSLVSAAGGTGVEHVGQLHG